VSFADRADAGRRLAACLDGLRGGDLVVLGLPRGGVPVGFEVAKALAAPLDVIVVRKLGVPFQPELGMGAIGEDGVRVINAEVVRAAGVSAQTLAAVERRERAELDRRVARFRASAPGKGQARVPLAGRTAIVVDDGIATGSTAQAAAQVARAQGAARIILAVAMAGLRRDFDQVVCLETPTQLWAIGQWYHDFSQTPDEEVVRLLDRARAVVDVVGPGDRDGGAAGAEGARNAGSARGAGSAQGAGVLGDAESRSSREDDEARSSREVEVVVRSGVVELAGRLTVPEGARGLVLFAHGSGSSRRSPRNRYVAGVLNQAGLGTLLFDLLTSDEGSDRTKVFDARLLADRLAGATEWLRRQPEAAGVRIGYFGASTGAAAALRAAAEPDADIGAVVSRGGRPDLAGGRLAEVHSPTLLIVGSKDVLVVEFNRLALAQLPPDARLTLVPGATHLFEEPGTLQMAASVARDWFRHHL
jgi:putative phosphoribosyl transferase